MKSYMLVTATFAVLAGVALAQERSAGQAYDAQINWSALSGKLDLLATQNKALAAVIDKMNTCSTRKMIYTPGDSAADADGCVAVSAALPSDYCYAQQADRWQGVTCEEGYYMKAMTKETDGDWDGYGAVCCYSKPGKDARVEADRARFITRMAANSLGGTRGIIAASLGMPYSQLANNCQANPKLYTNEKASCPYPNVLAK